MKLVMYRCESCWGAFGLPEEHEKDFPYCPLCADDDTSKTAELVEGDVKPDDREWDK